MCMTNDTLKRKEVAALMKVTTRTVDTWARAGMLSKCYTQGKQRSVGFESAAIMALLAEAGRLRLVHAKIACRL